ncbi:PLP-dependent lyase/thiolase [Streptomyces sp. 150FB]|uniref:PLP-dependent lyase/thiolase n=1 Tax=Streptomyces sp. 150FB TaxID=1576605 RepID=UPI00069704DB|nr:PLP-dependent lyase/thiolase [Streptomyces sp. 150FB]
MRSEPAVPAAELSVESLECIRCARRVPVAEHPFGCPSCAAQGQNSNLFCRYAPGTDQEPRRRLPYASVPDLGQGATRMLRLPWLEDVLVKNEAANPTGSHKDRFAAMTAAHARAAGYASVVVASSGNAGIAMAAFAASAGLGALVAGFSWLPGTVRDQLRQLGAEVRTFDTDAERTAWVRRMAEREDVLAVSNIADVVVGSNCLGIEGYKEIAWEMAEQAGGAIDHVVLPSSRGDLAWGVHLGFSELNQMHGVPVPRLHLVEPFPRLAAVLSGTAITSRFTADHGELHSIAGDSTTVQAHAAVTRSAGSAVVVPSATARAWFERAGRHGHTWEISSCAALAAYADLRGRKVITVDERTVLVATSHLFKNL